MKNVIVKLLGMFLFLFMLSFNVDAQNVDEIEINDGLSKNVQYIPISYNGKELLNSTNERIRGATKGKFWPYRLTDLLDAIVESSELGSVIADSIAASGGGGGASYLVYTALLTQTGGTDPPVVIVLENTLGGALVWEYIGPGSYKATLNGAFPIARTYTTIASTHATTGYYVYNFEDNNSLGVIAKDIPSNTFVDRLYYSSFEVRVYPE